MAYAYWKSGMDKKESVFHLSFRKPPFKGGFTVACGLEQAVSFLQDFRYDDSDLAYLQGLEDSSGKPFFEKAFLTYLKKLKFECSVDAVPEGTVVFPHEPLLRIEGPLIQCQLFESPLLNLINFPTLIATKAARVAIAAEGGSVFEFGLRRAQGIDGAMTASRAAYVGGCDGTSNVLAGKEFGIPVRGTHSHSFVMAFDSEEEAFSTYAKVLPDSCVLLVDTYNSIEGIKHAIDTGRKLEKRGQKLGGVRLDSGDLAFLSIQARKMLDEAGFKSAKIVASNELDETIITELKRQGAKIDVWGVGTNLVTAKDQPALDGVYKLAALKDPGEKWTYKLKLSEQMLKISNPGILQVRRFIVGHEYVADTIYSEDRPIKGSCKQIDLADLSKELSFGKSIAYEDLLVPIFRKGKLVYSLPSLEGIRKRREEQLKHFPKGLKRFLNPQLYPVGMEKGLYETKMRLIREIRENSGIGMVSE
ncbi:MAG: nicotinate phosphoribosyltransferase [Parachlamydiaceae bacterium]